MTDRHERPTTPAITWCGERHPRTATTCIRHADHGGTCHLGDRGEKWPTEEEPQP